MRSTLCLAALAAAALPLAAPVRAQAPDDARVAAAVERVRDSITEIRHRIHQYPELGNREFRTAGLVAEHLRRLGLEVRTGVAHTGVVAVLRGGRPGPVVAVRADMDALPVTEQNDLPWRSTERTTYLGQDVGVMHACGHDIHVAVQLGVASVLAGMRERLPGTVLFIFQPAEEGPPPGERGGAALMLEEGAFRDPRPEAVFGLHAKAEMDVGTVGYAPGPFLAGASSWRATVRGRQAHGAMPHLAVDPIVMASEAVLALQTIRARTLSPFTPSVVTVGIIRGGERGNIIPAEVQLSGTIRYYDEAVRDTIARRMREIFAGVTGAHGGRFELDVERGLPVTINNRELTARVVPTLERVLGARNVRLIEPWSASEDFSYFANEVPGFFFNLGTQAPGTTSGGHHTPTFRADDAAIPVGIRAMTALVLDYLNGGTRSGRRETGR
jgi:amidohydrolase